MIVLPFFLALAFTLFAGLYDLKTSNVHEEVPALLGFFGVFYWLIFSLINSDFSYIISSLVTGGVFLSIALLLYKAKIWGDGDAWILGSIGFCLPSLTSGFLSPITGLISYPAYFLFNLLLVGGVYSIFYIFAYGVLHEGILKAFWHEFNKLRPVYIGAIFAGFLVSVYMPYFFLIGFLPLLYTYARVVEKGMRKKIPITELSEDDVLVGGDIRGLTPEEFEKLKKTKKFVEIQDGVRFTIVFPLTLIFLYYGGFFGLLAMFA